PRRGPPWADKAPPPRAGGEPLPGIDELTAAAVRDSMLRYGCAFLPGLISKEEVELLKAGIDLAFAGLDKLAAADWYRNTTDDDPAEHAAMAPWYFRFDDPS